jgi:hypothetical protein
MVELVIADRRHGQLIAFIAWIVGSWWKSEDTSAAPMMSPAATMIEFDSTRRPGPDVASTRRRQPDPLIRPSCRPAARIPQSQDREQPPRPGRGRWRPNALKNGRERQRRENNSRQWVCRTT